MKRTIWLMLAIAFGMIIPSQAVQCQELDLNRTVDRTTEVVSLEDSANALSYVYGVPIAMILTADRNDRTKAIKLKAGTIREVLDQMVVEFPKYRWFEDNGVVNIVPVEPIDTKLDAVLRAATLEDFGKRTLRREDLYQVVRSDSLFSSAAIIGIRVGVIMGQWQYDDESYVLCACTTPTLRTTLDSIIKQSSPNHRMWTVTRHKNEIIFSF